MKTLLLAVISIVFAKQSYSQNPAVADILVNTFLIKTSSGQLTAFLVEYKSEEYLVTARHGFKNSNNSSVSLMLLYDTTFIILKGKLFLHTDSTIDIAIIKLNQKIQKMKPLEIAESITIGQECMFLGFPYGYFYSKLPKTELPTLPFVKKAIVSALANKITFLDGINNPGFSGGPVVIFDNITHKVKIYGVISGYYPEYNQIKDSANKKIKSLNYYFNSGIIFCYPISLIKEILP